MAQLFVGQMSELGQILVMGHVGADFVVWLVMTGQRGDIHHRVMAGRVDNTTPHHTNGHKGGFLIPVGGECGAQFGMRK